MNMHKVYIIGAGPGDPGLITVKGRDILREADVIIYDYLVDRRILAYAKDGAELIAADSLIKKEKLRSPLARQDKINAVLIKKARQGKKVVRLKGGDPFIFGRLADEIKILSEAGIAFEVVAAPTAASAAAAAANIALTDRGFSSSCVFVNGHQQNNENTIDWQSISKSKSIVFYMGVAEIADITTRLLKAGKSPETTVIIVQAASLAWEQIIRAKLSNIVAVMRKQAIKPPAIIIVREETEQSKHYAAKRILFTGLSKQRYFLHDNFLHLPLIKIEPLKDYTGFDMHLRNIQAFDWVVFCSRYGVEYFFERLRIIGKDIRALAHLRFAALGNSTKNKLLEFGIIADIVPEPESSQALLRRLQKEQLAGKKVFLPRSDLSDKSLEKGLRSLGAVVVSCVAYRNIMPDDLPDIDIDSFDEIYFTSPSTVRNFKKRYKMVPASVKIRCLGEVTLKEAKRCQLIP